MIKGNSYILIFSVLIFLIILLVSTTPVIIKTLLTIVTTGFLFPVFRKLLFKYKFRKVKVVFFTSLTFTLGLFLITVIDEHSLDLSLGSIGFFIVVLFYSLLGNFIYGLPASLVAELISVRFLKIRFWLSGFIHIGFGMGTYFIIHDLYMSAIICSVIFFILDEITKKSFTPS